MLPSPSPPLPLILSADRSDASRVAADWWGGGNEVMLFSRSAWSMRLLARYRAATTAGATTDVWLPAYFCYGATALLRAEPVRLRFYPVTAELEPDWPGCEALAAEAPPGIFVLVHYFGRAAREADAARAFCDRHGAMLAEDAAHVLRPFDGIGTLGDVTFYSPYKLVPVPDGGVLVTTSRIDDDAMARAASELGSGAPATAAWVVKQCTRAAMPEAVQRNYYAARTPAFDADPPDIEPGGEPTMSPRARRMLAALAPARDAIAARRRRNAEVWREWIAGGGLGGTGALAVLDEDTDAPYALPIRFPSQDAAAGAYASLAAQGVPVQSWPDLPPEVRASPAGREIALELRQRQFLVPVHQSLDPGALAGFLSRLRPPPG